LRLSLQSQFIRMLLWEISRYGQQDIEILIKTL